MWGSTLSRTSWPMRDLGDNLTADLDGLGVDTYNISEAFLSLPSLTVFKQEAPSPSPNENGVAHMSPLSLGTNLVEPETPVSNKPTQQLQSSPLHHLLQPALPGPQQSPNQECSTAIAAVSPNNPAVESFFPNATADQTPPIGDCRFQYVLAAATSIATKVTEETLTYLNQGQSYEIKLKKLGELSNYRGRVLKVFFKYLFLNWIFCSVIRICFHDRRLQYMEREQITAWQASRPGERIVEVDVPLSYGAFDISQDSSQLNTVEFLWDATKEVGVYIKVNCISTEFTPKKHGGEKGVPFRVQIETFLHGDNSAKRLHAAACQIKVFKLKGADRKHKQDREKIMKRPMQEQDKFQPSYDCTVLTDISNEAVAPPMSTSASPCVTIPAPAIAELGKYVYNKMLLLTCGATVAVEVGGQRRAQVHSPLAIIVVPWPSPPNSPHLHVLPYPAKSRLSQLCGGAKVLFYQPGLLDFSKLKRQPSLPVFFFKRATIW
ncbi:hypothetical protein FOCC_FOCC000678 [Frankliniella occidentalis]|nr:hypothetical protein FOCC_FOCC000678 [Frankliniella occidentalis]